MFFIFRFELEPPIETEGLRKAQLLRPFYRQEDKAVIRVDITRA